VFLDREFRKMGGFPPVFAEIEALIHRRTCGGRLDRGPEAARFAGRSTAVAIFEGIDADRARSTAVAIFAEAGEQRFSFSRESTAVAVLADEQRFPFSRKSTAVFILAGTRAPANQ